MPMDYHPIIEAIWFAVAWWTIDMAAPVFEHDEDDVQARIAEMAVSRASRPARVEIIAFSRELEELLKAALLEADEIELHTRYEPEGLLADAVMASGRRPNVHHLSWFQSMKIKVPGTVHTRRGKDSWMLIFGGEQ
jgi:hypothetical protein